MTLLRTVTASNQTQLTGFQTIIVLSSLTLIELKAKALLNDWELPLSIYLQPPYIIY